MSFSGGLMNVNRKLQGQRGASLTELLVVLVVGSILVTVGLSQLGGADRNLVRQNIAREFKVSLERPRFDSVKRRPSTSAEESRVTILSATSFTYTTDLNQNGRLDTPGETLTVDFANRSNVRIVGTNFVYPITVSFDAKGEITVTNGTTPPAISPIFYFCNGTCTVETANGENANKIYVSPTGTVVMMDGGEVLATFATPPVTAVTPEDYVNPYLAVWTDPAGSPTASPSGTPSPSPSTSATATATGTATATATSTATATATATATPTATPVVNPSPVATATATATATPTTPACTYGQKPDRDNCICYSPMSVRRNGQCQ